MAGGVVAEAEGTFPTGGRVLFRRSVLPTGQRPWSRLALLHGYGDHGGRYLHFFRWLAARGVACHALDFRGHGRSPGPHGYVRRWDEFLDDLGAFLSLDELGTSAPPGPLFVLGHSHGGLVAAAAGIRGMLDRHRAAGCILSAPYLRGLTPVSPPWRAIAHLCNWTVPWVRVPSGLRDGSMSSDPDMLADSRRDPLLHRVATPRWYLSTLKVQAEVMERAGEFRLPLLCLAGTADDIADPAAVRDFYERCGSADKALRVYPDRLHELLREVEREGMFGEILDWMAARASEWDRVRGSS